MRLALVAIAAVAASGPAAGNHQWGSYHWSRAATPLTLKINTALTGKWPAIVQTSVGQWNQSVLNFAQSSTNGANSYLFASGRSAKQCNPIAGQILVCNALYGQRGWLGIATIWANGDHITQGTTKLNDTYFNMARYNTPYWRAMVACQEVGHDFGLGHVNETFTDKNTGSCMDYTNDPNGGAGGASSTDPSNERPNSHDYTQLESIYKQHFDSTTTVGQISSTANKPPAAAANEADLDDDPRNFGQLIRLSPDRRLALYEKDLGAERRVFRFVIWAYGAPQTNGKGRQGEPTHD